MVEAFVGLVGGGKSYNSVRRMMAYMALGGRCCSNIRLAGWDGSDLSADSPVRDYLRSIGWEYQPRQYVYISFDDMMHDFKWIERVPAGVDRDHRTLLVVDEATDLFDSLDGGRLRVDSDYREMFHFLRLSRHVHVDVLFIAQDISSINSRLRGLVAYIWKSTDMKSFRMAKLKVPFPFDLFMLQQFDKSGKYEVRREWVKKDYRVFGLYESEAFNNSMSVKWDGVAVSADAGKIKNKGVKKMSFFQKLLLLLSLGLSLYSLFRGGGSGGVVGSSVCTTNFVCQVYSNVVSSSSPSALPVASSNCYIRGAYYYHSMTGVPDWVVFKGCPVRMGVPCEWGTPVRITPTHTYLEQIGGGSVFLLPLEDEIPNVFSPVQIKVYSKKGGAKDASAVY